MRSSPEAAARPLRACFLTGIPPQRYSGATFHAIWLAEQMASLDVAVEFLALAPAGVARDPAVGGFRVHYASRGSGRSAEMVLWPQLFWFFLRHRYDVLHVHSCGYHESFAALAARMVGMPSIGNVMQQGVDLGGKGRLTGPLHRRLLRNFDRIVPISEETLEEARSVGIPPDRLVKIPISVDLERFRPVSPERKPELRARYHLPSTRQIVVFVGAFSHRKNVVWLLDAWRGRPGRLSEVDLLIVGDAANDPEGPVVRREVQDRLAAAGGRVHWIPFVREIEDIYALADALVLPSFREGMPTVVLQAMACGTPVVCTPVSGAPELLGAAGERGFLYPFDDSNRLFQGLGRILTDAEAGGRIARAACAYVAEHNALDVVARRYRDVYVALSRS